MNTQLCTNDMMTNSLWESVLSMPLNHKDRLTSQQLTFESIVFLVPSEQMFLYNTSQSLSFVM